MKIYKILFCLFLQTATAATSYRVSAGGSLYINEWGIGVTVSNGLASDLFVPTNSQTEFTSFVNATIPGVSLTYQAASCYALLLAGNTTSGIYSIDPLNNGTNINVYCDMTTNGGGWTLIARSVSGATNTSFSWNEAQGSVSDDAAPYSMNVVAYGLQFENILFGVYTSAKTWGSYVYRKVWTQTDITTYASSAVSRTVTAVIGGNSGFNMAAMMGFTSSTGRYYFRDCCGNSSYGLLQNGWLTSYNTAYGGFLNGTQGMIMVR